MKKLILAIIILMCVLASVLIVFNRNGSADPVSASAHSGKTDKDEEGSAVVYVRYAGTYLSLDKNWKVCANNSDNPSGIPEAEGLVFKRLVYGQKAEPKDNSSLEYVIKVALDLEKNGLKAEKISYDSRMITVTMGRLQIKLGKNDKTDEKINDLSDLLDQIEGASGVLDMQNGNANNYGYTFRAN